MNVEFQIHGVLANGQSFWKQDDKDYYQTFYSPQAKNSLMTVEVLKRPRGLCTYYNYLRYNNVISVREGSYFGMSVRIDGEYCVDVRGMYDILDNLFEKKVTGKLLMPIDSGKLKYSTENFENTGTLLSEIEENFSMMYSAFFGPDDFVAVSAPSQNKSYQINPIDLSPALVNQAISLNLKITLSPEILPLVAQDIEKQFRASKSESTAESERRACEEAAGRYEAEISALRSEARSLREELAEFKSRPQQCGKDYEILENLRKLRLQMEAACEMIRVRLPETASPDNDQESSGDSSLRKFFTLSKKANP